MLPLLLAAILAIPLAAQEPEAPASEPPEGPAPAFRVVVHAENPTDGLPAAKIARMFLKKLKRWDHGVRVVPIDLEAKSPTREVFTQSVHNKSVTAIQSFWQRMIFSGRDVPPDQKSSEQEVLEFVRANSGAIGYVAGSVSLGDDVKELKVIP